MGRIAGVAVRTEELWGVGGGGGDDHGDFGGGGGEATAYPAHLCGR